MELKGMSDINLLLQLALLQNEKIEELKETVVLLEGKIELLERKAELLNKKN